ncbi:MAG: hypothetical protein R8N23_13590 [Reichenbachiella sp.]|uniref:hypothetical protein n=1 Tax=Reichenbachiella sp. TaxID=2184521 RepID=UPI0029674C52|nr:hypothetical protein [Reichenbachiella sp.]MDW3210903.1 hypothetical protein [Reichenbachiella sp.]
MMHSSKMLLGILSLFLTIQTVAQTNTSTESNYKVKQNKSGYYKTVYDNGYVTLRDGTVLDGQISLLGSSYEKVSGVRIKTNSGDKYYFMVKSLKEYGLSNSSINDTPTLFSWGAVEKSPFTAYKNVRTGSTSFGYVKTRSGNEIEGRLRLKEVNGKVVSMEIRDSKKETFKFESDEVSNYGVRVYKDPKFENSWSLISWESNSYYSSFANVKSVPMPGYVITNNGQKHEGSIQLIKKATMITGVNISKPNVKKPVKLKYGDIKSYGANLTVQSYHDVLANVRPLEQYLPMRKFHQGTVLLTDESELKGWVAFATNSDLGDVLFAESDNGSVQGFSSEDVEEVTQEIGQEEIDTYDQYVYDSWHVNDYLIQYPPQYIYKFKNPDMQNIFETEFQPGYVVLKSGETKVGSFSIVSQGTIVKYLIKIGDNKPEKYPAKEVARYGLIQHEPKTAFPQRLFNEPKPGFVVLMGSGERVVGELTIRIEEANSRNGFQDGVMLKTFIVKVDGDKRKFEESSIDVYGLTDVAVSDLTNDGVIVFDDKKQNFHPGSFNEHGVSKNGWIAWAKPVKKGDYDAFFFAEDINSTANVFYVSNGASDVVQNIEEEFAAYDPADDSFLMTKTIETDVVSNGYIITADGHRIDGEVQISFPPKLWFATDVIITDVTGTVSEYTSDGALSQVFVTVDGQQKEFIAFDNAYVEVLQREGDWVHFRNPHPTTPTLGSDLLNYFSGAAMTAGQDYVDQKVAEGRVKAALEGNDEAVRAADNFLKRERTDFMSYDQFAIYAKEHIIMDTEQGRHSMYIPGANYQQVEAELMGSIDYLKMDTEEQKGLRKMNNPAETLKYLDTTF